MEEGSLESTRGLVRLSSVAQAERFEDRYRITLAAVHAPPSDEVDTWLRGQLAICTQRHQLFRDLARSESAQAHLVTRRGGAVVRLLATRDGRPRALGCATIAGS